MTAAAGATLSAVDYIDGGAGIDTLNTTAATAGDITGGALIKNVENINVRVTSGTAATLDASSTAGLTNINANLGTGTLVATKLATGAAVTVTGDGNVVNGAVGFTYATNTDAVTLNVAGGTKMTGMISANATISTASDQLATKATINSTGAANVVGTVDLANATLTSVTINAATNLKGDFLSQATDQVGTDGVVTIAGAAASVEFTAALDNTIKTIDASGLTAGGLTATLGTGITSFKGGQGNDVITTAATTATGAVIDAGAGTGDKLVLAATNDVNTALKGAQYKNFEILGLNSDQDVSLISGITALELNAMTSKTISKITAAQAAAITVTGDQATALTLTLADVTGSSDKVALNLKSATATTNVSVAGLSIVGVESLDVAATTGTPGSTSNLAFAASGADKLTAINLSGTADAKITGTNTSKAITLASTDTGAVTIDGNWVSGSSFTLGGGKDTITLGTGFNTYNAGAGDDTFNATAAQLNTGANYNVINGGDGTDTLNITDGAAAVITIVDNNLSKISGIEKIVITSTTTGNQSIQTGGWFDAAFKANGVDLTTTTTKGTVTIDMTSFSGAAKLNVTTVGTGTTEGAINVQTGSGNDDVTVSAAAAGGAGTIMTFDGNDKITTTGTEDFAITAGKGNDTIVLGSTGKETLTFEATAANNGVDTITGFEFGATKDVLQFKNFVGAPEAETLSATIAGSVDASAKNVLTLTDIQDLTAANFGGTASTTVIKTTASQKLVVIADKAGDLDAFQNIYYVTTDASNVATVTLVGTINEGTFHTDNIITA